MLTMNSFLEILSQGPVLLDGATGSNLRKAGMPRGCSTETWVLDHPEVILDLQSRYAKAGSRILYAPTFQAQEIALPGQNIEKINRDLVALTRQAAPDALVAGDLATLSAFLDAWDADHFDVLVEQYRRQVAALLDAGVDLLVGETLLYPQEGEAILTAAALEGAEVIMLSYTMQSDGSLFSGRDAGPVLRELEEAGAAAVGFNCVGADSLTPALVSKLRRYVKGPILAKPNAGVPVIDHHGIPQYPMGPEEFATIMADCAACGANLLGGCCGTDPEYIEAARQRVCQFPLDSVRSGVIKPI